MDPDAHRGRGPPVTGTPVATCDGHDGHSCQAFPRSDVTHSAVFGRRSGGQRSLAPLAPQALRAGTLQPNIVEAARGIEPLYRTLQNVS